MSNRQAGMLASLFALATVFYSFVWDQAPVVTPDSRSYLRAAADLADGIPSRPQPRAVLYPLLLLALDAAPEPNRMLFLASLLLRYGEIVALALVLRAIGLGSAGLLAFTVVMLLPPYMQSTAFVLTETLTGFLLAFGSMLLYFGLERGRTQLAAFASLAYGLAALARPTFQLIAPALALAILVTAWWHSRTTLRAVIRPTLALASVATVLVVSISLYNSVRFGYFGLTYLLGFNLAVRTTNLYEKIEDPAVRRILIQARNEARLSGDNPYWSVFRAVKPLTAVTGETDIGLAARLKQLCARVILRNPVAYAEETARSLSTFWSPYTTKLPMMRFGPAMIIWYGLQGVVASGFFVMFFLNAGAAALFGRPPPIRYAALTTFVIAVGITAYNAAVSCAIDWGETRHRTPTDGLMLFAIFAGFLLWRAYRADAWRGAVGRP